MDIQLQHQRLLNQEANNAQYEMWRKTNYPAQVGMMNKAGLNPALMYGLGGGAGTTAGSVGAGSAASGQAPQPMDISNSIQAAVQTANIELAKSQAEKNRAEAESIRGEEGTKGAAEIEKMIAETNTEWQKQWLVKAQTAVQQTEFYKIGEIIKGLEIDNNINEATKEEQKQVIINEAISSALDDELKRSNIDLNEAKVNEIWHEIRRKWVEAGFKGLDTIIKGVLGGKAVGKMGKAKGSDTPLSDKAREGLNNM